MLRKLLPCLCAVLLLTGCGAAVEETVSSSASTAETQSTASDPEQPESTGVYTNESKTFQLTVPPGWKEDAAQSVGTRTVLRSPDGSRSLELTEQEADPNLLAYSEADFERSYGAQFDDFSINEFSDAKSEKNKGVFLRFTCTQQGKPITVYQTIFAGDSDYSITYTAANPDKEFFQEVRESFSSFRELDPLKDAALLAGRINGRVYTTVDGSCRITLPEGWRCKKAEQDTAIFVDSKNQANLVLTAHPLDSRLFQYQKSYYKEYFSQRFGFSSTIRTLETENLGEYKAKHLELEYNYYSNPMVADQYLVNTKDNTYTITLTTRASKKKDYNLSKIAATFQEVKS